MALEDRAGIVSRCPTPRRAESTSPAARRAVIPALNSRSRPGPTSSFRVLELENAVGDGAPFSTGVPCPITQALIGCAGESPFGRDGATFLVAEFAKARASVRPEVQVEESPRARRLYTLSRFAALR